MASLLPTLSMPMFPSMPEVWRMVVLRLAAAMVILAALAVGAFVIDQVANEGRLFYAVAGRDRLVALCTPPIREDLAKRGFAPADIAFGSRPSISFSTSPFGRARTLAGPFTFTDGPTGPRVDGSAMCTVRGADVTVEVEVDSLPVRSA